jgi:hypothetical protein
MTVLSVFFITHFHHFTINYWNKIHQGVNIKLFPFYEEKGDTMFSDEVKEGIKEIIRRMMEGVVNRRIVEEPWNPEEEKENKPFHFAIAPELVWKGSKFERSLVTSMGQIGWEQIARIIAEDYHGYAENGKAVIAQTYSGRLNHIRNILDQLEHKKNKRKPNWDVELAEVLAINEGEMERVHVTADLYVYNEKTNQYYYCEIKAPKPNSDQTKVSKEKMLKIKAMYPEDNHHVYYVLPYNPYGKREDYDHPHPKRWFDMINDEVVLMGKEFWDLMGGKGTYEDLIDIFKEVGQEYLPRINKDYFGIDD